MGLEQCTHTGARSQKRLCVTVLKKFLVILSLNLGFVREVQWDIGHMLGVQPRLMHGSRPPHLLVKGSQRLTECPSP